MAPVGGTGGSRRECPRFPAGTTAPARGAGGCQTLVIADGEWTAEAGSAGAPCLLFEIFYIDFLSWARTPIFISHFLIFNFTPMISKWSTSLPILYNMMLLTILNMMLKDRNAFEILPLVIVFIYDFTMFTIIIIYNTRFQQIFV
jgi:hypothetical protein